MVPYVRSMLDAGTFFVDRGPVEVALRYSVDDLTLVDFRDHGFSSASRIADTSFRSQERARERDTHTYTKKKVM